MPKEREGMPDTPPLATGEPASLVSPGQGRERCPGLPPLAAALPPRYGAQGCRSHRLPSHLPPGPLVLRRLI